MRSAPSNTSVRLLSTGRLTRCEKRQDNVDLMVWIERTSSFLRSPNCGSTRSRLAAARGGASCLNSDLRVLLRAPKGSDAARVSGQRDHAPFQPGSKSNLGLHKVAPADADIYHLSWVFLSWEDRINKATRYDEHGQPDRNRENQLFPRKPMATSVWLTGSVTPTVASSSIAELP